MTTAAENAAALAIRAGALIAIEKLHQPEHGMGYRGDGYGTVDPACSTCGTTDEYAVPWPCETFRAACVGLGKPVPEAIPVETW